MERHLMAGFLPIAHDALAACADDLDRFAVLDLYQRAHACRWRPLRVTERSLVTKWRMGNRRVWSLLEGLEAFGCVKVTKGGRRTPSIIVVICPTGVQQSDQLRDQQSDQQNGAGSKGAIGKRAASNAAQDAAQDAATLSETQEEDTEIKTQEENKAAVPASLAWWSKAIRGRKYAKRLGTKAELVSGIQQVLHRWRGDALDATPAKGPASQVLKLWDAMAESYPDAIDLAKAADRAALIAEACVACPDEIFAKHIRGEGWEGKSDASRNAAAVFRVNPPPNSSGADWETRLRAALAWDAAGRRAALPTGPSALGFHSNDDDEQPTEGDLRALRLLQGGASE